MRSQAASCAISAGERDGRFSSSGTMLRDGCGGSLRWSLVELFGAPPAAELSLALSDPAITLCRPSPNASRWG